MLNEFPCKEEIIVKLEIIITETIPDKMKNYGADYFKGILIHLCRV